MFDSLNSEHVVQTNEDKSTGAILSKDLKYRYLLWRKTSEDLPDDPWIIAFVGLNPSTADGLRNDMTIRKCCGFADRWGYHWMLMLNVSPYKSTSPAELVTPSSSARAENRCYLQAYTSRANEIVCCWGADVARIHQAIFDEAWAAIARPNWCLGRTKQGFPRHPSRLAYKTELEPFNRR